MAATTSLLQMRRELSRQIDDYFLGDATGGTTTTILDKTLMDKRDDWVADARGIGGQTPTSILICGASEERVVTTFSATTWTLTTYRPFSASATSTYEVHRMFTATEKDEAIQRATRNVFPSLYTEVKDSSIRFGDWGRNTDFEVWSQTTHPDYWDATGLTCAAATTGIYVHRGGKCAQLSGATGTLKLTEDKLPDLMFLAGKKPTFYAWGWSDTTGALRLSIYDGTTTITRGTYHTGGSHFELLSVTQSIADEPPAVEFGINRDASGTAVTYIDDAAITCVGGKYEYDIADLGLHNNQPLALYEVLQRNANSIFPRPKDDIVRIPGEYWESPRADTLLRFKSKLTDGRTILIEGIKHLDYPTGATTYVNCDEKQMEIIVAEAAVDLYKLLINRSPSQDIDRYEKSLAYWERETRRRKAKHGMPIIPGTVHR